MAGVDNNKTADSFVKNVENYEKDGLSITEKKVLRGSFYKLSKEEQSKVLEKYKDLKDASEIYLLNIKKTTEKFLSSLKEDVEKKTPKTSFESIEKDFEKSEATKEFLKMVGSYVDGKLDKGFSDTEKGNVKVVILGEIEKNLDLGKLAKKANAKIFEPLQKLIYSFGKKAGEKDESKKTEDLSKTLTELEKAFSSLGIKGKIKEIDEKIEQINLEKKNNKKQFNSLASVMAITDPKAERKSDKEIMASIKSETEKLSKNLDKGKISGDAIKKGLKELPFNLGEDFKGYLKGLAEKYPVLGIIFSLFLGKDFLNEENGKMGEATKNLQEFSKNDKFPLKSIITTKQLEKLDSKKLDKFYKYLDSEKIDYLSDTFWQELLTGNSKNEKIKELHKILTQDGKVKGILQGDELKGNILDNFVKKLNGLGEIESDKKKEKTAKTAKDVADKKEETAQTAKDVATKKEETVKIAEDAVDKKEKVAQTAKDVVDKKEKVAQTAKDVVDKKEKVIDVADKKEEELIKKAEEITNSEEKEKLLKEAEEAKEAKELAKKEVKEAKEAKELADKELEKAKETKELADEEVEEAEDVEDVAYEEAKEAKKAEELANKEVLIAKEASEKADYIKDIDLITLKKDLKFNNGVFELPHGIKFKYEVDFKKEGLVVPKVIEEVSIQSIGVIDNKMNFNMKGKVEISIFSRDLSKKPSIILDEELESILNNLQEDKINIPIITDAGNLGNFVLQKV